MSVRPIQKQWHTVTALINLLAFPKDDVIGTEPGWWPTGLRGPTLIISLSRFIGLPCSYFKLRDTEGTQGGRRRGREGERDGETERVGATEYSLINHPV